MITAFEETLEKYAEIIVRVGLNLQAGQRLLIQAPIESALLVRRVAALAYDQGVRLVDVHWGDDQLTLARFQHAPRDSFDEFPEWRAQAAEEVFKNGGAYLSLYAEDPDLLKDQDPALVSQAQKTTMQHMLPAVSRLMHNATNWLVVSMPIPSWAAKVFPGLPEAEQMEKLWQAIFRVCRLEQPDPVDAWKRHVVELGARSQYLTRKQYSALHITGPGTDLEVGLPSGHLWLGGQITSGNGIDFIPNVPTEEVFTMPHKDRVAGVVRASRPLSYAGRLIEDFQLTFQDGKVVDFQAAKGEQVLRQLLETDEGARRLGEVALVPYSSPISQSGILFYNTLFDENAASHLALGKAYSFTMQGGEEMPDEAFAEAGGNHSLVHVDFMSGTAETNVDGLLEDGTAEALMRQGEWAFDS